MWSVSVFSVTCQYKPCTLFILCVLQRHVTHFMWAVLCIQYWFFCIAFYLFTLYRNLYRQLKLLVIVLYPVFMYYAPFFLPAKMCFIVNFVYTCFQLYVCLYLPVNFVYNVGRHINKHFYRHFMFIVQVFQAFQVHLKKIYLSLKVFCFFCWNVKLFFFLVTAAIM